MTEREKGRCLQKLTKLPPRNFAETSISTDASMRTMDWKCIHENLYGLVLCDQTVDLLAYS